MTLDPLPMLTHLSLSHNSISGTTIWEFVSILGKLVWCCFTFWSIFKNMHVVYKKLFIQLFSISYFYIAISLNITNKNFFFFFYFHSRLQTLDLSDNLISGVPSDMCKSPRFPCLTTLDLSSNPISKEHDVISLAELPQLKFVLFHIRKVSLPNLEASPWRTLRLSELSAQYPSCTWLLALKRALALQWPQSSTPMPLDRSTRTTLWSMLLMGKLNDLLRMAYWHWGCFSCIWTFTTTPNQT